MGRLLYYNLLRLSEERRGSQTGFIVRAIVDSTYEGGGNFTKGADFKTSSWLASIEDGRGNKVVTKKRSSTYLRVVQ